MSAGLEVLHESGVITLDESLLTKTKTAPLVAIGAHRDSRIDLYTLKYNGAKQASVFVYPSWYALRPDKLSELDPNISDVSNIIIFQEFNEVSVEDLDREFIIAAQRDTLTSFMDHPYNLHRPPIIEHSYINGAELLIKGIIEDLRLS